MVMMTTLQQQVAAYNVAPNDDHLKLHSDLQTGNMLDFDEHQPFTCVQE